MKNQLSLLSFLAALILVLPGCEVIGGIFKAGMGVGIFVVLLVVGLVIFLMSKMRKRS